MGGPGLRTVDSWSLAFTTFEGKGLWRIFKSSRVASCVFLLLPLSRKNPGLAWKRARWAAEKGFLCYTH
jgi:hypothetical protein